MVDDNMFDKLALVLMAKEKVKEIVGIRSDVIRRTTDKIRKFINGMDDVTTVDVLMSMVNIIISTMVESFNECVNRYGRDQCIINTLIIADVLCQFIRDGSLTVLVKEREEGDYGTRI